METSLIKLIKKKWEINILKSLFPNTFNKDIGRNIKNKIKEYLKEVIKPSNISKLKIYLIFIYILIYFR